MQKFLRDLGLCYPELIPRSSSDRSMRIGIDCRTILNPHSGERAGVGHYVEGLVSALIERFPKEEFVLYFDYRIGDLAGFTRPNVKVKHFPFSQYGKYLSFGYSHMLITAYLLKEGLDVLHVPAGSIPLTYPKKVVYTVHDLAIFKHPEWFPSSFISRSVLVPQTLRKADNLIAVSQSTAKDLRQLFNIKSSKISVIHHGFDVAKIPLKRRVSETIEKYKLPKRYVLFVGTIEPRKNVEGLMRAFVGLQEKKSCPCRCCPGHRRAGRLPLGTGDADNDRIESEAEYSVHWLRHAQREGRVTSPRYGIRLPVVLRRFWSAYSRSHGFERAGHHE